MTISTVSFDKAKIYHNKMFFMEYGKDSVSLKVFDSIGNNIVNRISHQPIKTIDGDRVIIMKKKEYEIPNQGIVFKTVKRIYDKFDNLLDLKKEFRNF